jgi:hypothetical protein
MTEKTKIIIDFLFNLLLKNDLVTEQRELTEAGLALKYAVLEYL